MKRLIAASNYPPVIEDIANGQKQENVLTSCFDNAQLVTKKEVIVGKTMPLITTNEFIKSERCVDREVLIQFVCPSCSELELDMAEEKVGKLRRNQYI